MQEGITFGGWPNCIRLSNGQTELIVTTDVGPRIISFGYKGGQNLLYVSHEDEGKIGGEEWHIYGGHRLWHSPEVAPRTYAPDNSPVSYSWNYKTLKLTQDIELTTGILKEFEITLNSDRSVSILHRLTNKNLWDVQLAPWAITALAPGGRIILPQETYINPIDYMLPSRPVVLWHYTKMNDPRWIWGDKYIQLKFDAALGSEQKLGLLNKQKWGAYYLNGELFIKTFNYDPKAVYADYGCNNEIWVNGTFLELESLGPLSIIPAGGFTEHKEQWFVARVEMNESEDSVEEAIGPLLKDSIFG
jgi:hypothetical protein